MIAPEKLFLFVFLIMFLYRSIVGYVAKEKQEESLEPIQPKKSPQKEEKEAPKPQKRRSMVYNASGIGVAI